MWLKVSDGRECGILAFPLHPSCETMLAFGAPTAPASPWSVWWHLFPRVLRARGHLGLSYWNEHTKRAVSQKWRLRHGSGHSQFAAAAAADSSFHFALKQSISSSKFTFELCTVQQSWTGGCRSKLRWLSWIWRFSEKEKSQTDESKIW